MTPTPPKVAFLVDFDNVATDVIEQAFEATRADYGAVHIRRAYCNAEQAQHQQAFLKRLGLRALVNLAIGKNSTDIALAVDAMDLALSERPDVIVLVSSDSDFAPLVLRLRERGAWMRGFGQLGKTGDGVYGIYDQYTELAHGGAAAKPTAKAAPARKALATKAAAKPAAKKTAPKAAGRSDRQADPKAGPEVARNPDAKIDPRGEHRPEHKAEHKTEHKPESKREPAPPARPRASPQVGAAARAAAPAQADVAAAKQIHAILAALPRLSDGHWHELNEASKALRDAGLLAKNASSAQLFRKHPQAFELQPLQQPRQVRFAR